MFIISRKRESPIYGRRTEIFSLKILIVINERDYKAINKLKRK